MKVTRNTPRQLIVEDMPWLIAIMLVFFIMAFVGPGILMMMDGVWQAIFFALAGGGMGVAALAVFVRRVQVILNLDEDTVTMRERSLFGYKQIVHQLSNLKEARLETTRGKEGGTLYRPVLILDEGMSAGTHPIIESYTNTGGPKRLVDAINDWLKETRRAQASA